jgi:hypothetical protein
LGQAKIPSDSSAKDQLKIQINREAHRKLRALCDRSRRTPAGQIEFMTIMFYDGELEKRIPPL